MPVFGAVVYMGREGQLYPAVYCVGCIPSNQGVNDPEVSPIFADSEWDYYPACDYCGEKHKYMKIREVVRGA